MLKTGALGVTMAVGGWGAVQADAFRITCVIWYSKLRSCGVL